MSQRKIYEGLPLPAFLRPQAAQGTVLEVDGVSQAFRRHPRRRGREPHGRRRRNPRPDRPERRRQDHAVQPRLAAVRAERRHDPAQRHATSMACRSQQICQQRPRPLVPDHQPVPRPRRSTRTCACRCRRAIPSASTCWRDIDSYADVHAETAELIRFLGLEGIEQIEGGELSYGGQRLVDLGIALGSKPQVLLLDEPLAGLAAAERERVSNLVKNVAANIPVLIVEHDIDRVLGFSHRVTVMNQGEVLMTGTPERGARRPPRAGDLHRHRRAAAVAGARAAASAETTRCCASSGVNAFYGKSHILNDATLDVREGEIVALLGRNGAGKSTLLKTLGRTGAAGLRHDRVRRAQTSPACRRRTSRGSASATCRRAAACSPA